MGIGFAEGQSGISVEVGILTRVLVLADLLVCIALGVDMVCGSPYRKSSQAKMSATVLYEGRLCFPNPNGTLWCCTDTQGSIEPQ
jgi:hypothetical protein